LAHGDSEGPCPGVTAQSIFYDTEPARSQSGSTIPDLEDIQLYPNPAEGSFTVNFRNPKSGIVDISIYNLYGRKLYETQITEVKTTTIEIADQLSSGMYIIKFNDGNKITTKHLVIKN